MTEFSQFYGTPVLTEGFCEGYEKGRKDEREHIIHLIEDGVWKDLDMLIEQIKEGE